MKKYCLFHLLWVLVLPSLAHASSYAPLADFLDMTLYATVVVSVAKLTVPLLATLFLRSQSL